LVGTPSWASFESREAEVAGGAARLRACSACAGDYEDPERTAEGPDDGSGEGSEDDADAFLEEFPAEEQ
jgi:hypothetical protein